MKTVAIFLTLCLVAVAFGQSFDCKNQEDDSRHKYPGDCTKFWVCDNGNAVIRNCGVCVVDEKKCPNGRLHFSVATKECGWVDEANCS